jgi:hypothetical protein
MKHTGISIISIAILMVLLPGCLYIDWGKRNFYQGSEVVDYTPDVRRYLRSATVYNQFSTCAFFDALWLSDNVRTIYAKVHSQRVGKDVEHARAFLWRQLEENKHNLTFLVLSLYTIPLDTEMAAWSLVLCINGKTIMPASIKAIDLAHEYTVFLANELSRFKVAYEVNFNVIDADGNSILKDARELVLQFRSVKKEVSLHWKLTGAGDVYSPYCITPDEPSTLVDGPTKPIYKGAE